MLNIIFYFSIICSVLGLLLVFTGNVIFIYLGAILHLITCIIGRINGQLKSFNTIYISVLLGILVSIITQTELITIISASLCLECLLNLIFGIIIVNEKNDSFEEIENLESESKTFEIEETNKIITIFNSIDTPNEKVNFFYKILSDLINTTLDYRVYISTATEWENNYFETCKAKLSEINIFLSSTKEMYVTLDNSVPLSETFIAFVIKKGYTKEVIEDIEDLKQIFEKAFVLIQAFVMSGSTSVSLQQQINTLSSKLIDKTNELSNDLQLLGAI